MELELSTRRQEICQNTNFMNFEKLKLILLKTIKVVCRHCGKPFDWNDQWPDGIKQCPYCGKQN